MRKVKKCKKDGYRVILYKHSKEDILNIKKSLKEFIEDKLNSFGHLDKEIGKKKFEWTDDHKKEKIASRCRKVRLDEYFIQKDKHKKLKDAATSQENFRIEISKTGEYIFPLVMDKLITKEEIRNAFITIVCFFIGSTLSGLLLKLLFLNS